MKSSIKLAFVILSSIIGAGFASGKEIYTFFFRYGYLGIFGIFISIFIIDLVIYKVLKICIFNNIHTYEFFSNTLINYNSKFAYFFNNIINIFLLFSFYIMASGFTNLFFQEFNFNKILSVIFLLAFNFFIVKNNIKNLSKISIFLIAFYLFFLFFSTIKNINNININNIFFDNINQNNLILFIISSVIYASYNCIFLIPFLTILSAKNVSKKELNLICFFVFFVLLLFILLIFLLLSAGNNYIFSMEMPLVFLINNLGFFYKIIYIIIIAFSIFTTLNSSFFSLINNLKIEKNNKYLLFLSISAIPFSLISFGKLIEFFYPLLGLIGLIQIVLILFYKCNN